MVKNLIEIYRFSGAAILFVACVISMFLPLCIKSFSWMKRMDALAGGVFLGAALVHLFPEGMHCLESFHFPLYAYMTLTGFFIMFVMESFAASHSHPHEHDHEHEDNNENSQPMSSLSAGLIESEDHNHENDSQESHFGTPFNKIPLTTKTLYGALMVHSIIESISFGIAQEKQVILSLFFALIGHKPVEVFALCVAILVSKPTKLKYFLMMGIYCFMTPITIVAFHFIGKSTGEVFAGVVTALSAGVFIFIGFHEIVEIMHDMPSLVVKEKLWYILFVFIGLLWMAVMGLFGEHDHGHEH